MAWLDAFGAVKGELLLPAGFAGKLGFVAPEQFGDFGREIGPWTDVYSLGALLYAMLVGRPPFQAASPMQTLSTMLTAIPKAQTAPARSTVRRRTLMAKIS